MNEVEDENPKPKLNTSGNSRKRQFSAFADGVNDQITSSQKSKTSKASEMSKEKQKGGKKPWKTVVENCSSYLRQDDVMYDAFTVQETLDDAVNLRIRDDKILGRQHKKQLVAKLIANIETKR